MKAISGKCKRFDKKKETKKEKNWIKIKFLKKCEELMKIISDKSDIFNGQKGTNNNLVACY